MTAALTFDVLLCVLLVGLAASAVLGRDLFASIVFFIVYGLFVAVAWVRLQAVDVALAEAAIGAGLTGVLLIRAAARLQSGEPVDSSSGGLRRPLVGLVCLFIGAALAALVLGVEWQADGLRPAVAENLARSGLGNPVTGVLLDFRGYDTLLETIVLLAALVGVWSLTPDGLWGGAPGLREHARPQGILSSFGRLLPPLGILVGVHLFWSGADAPGGAFQAGTVLAAAWILLLLAGGAEAPRTSSFRARLGVTLGPIVFLAVALAGLGWGAFLSYSPGLAKGLILLIEAGLTLSIAVTLALLVLGPPRLRQ